MHGFIIDEARGLTGKLVKTDLTILIDSMKNIFKMCLHIPKFNKVT